jgi:hypothetical protein
MLWKATVEKGIFEEKVVYKVQKYLIMWQPLCNNILFKVLKEDILIINIYAPQVDVSNFIKQILLYIKEFFIFVTFNSSLHLIGLFTHLVGFILSYIFLVVFILLFWV